MVMSVCFYLNVKYVYVFMEFKLVRRMKVFGIYFNLVGEVIEFNGKCMLYRLLLYVLFDDLVKLLKGFYRKIYLELNSVL